MREIAVAAKSHWGYDPERVRAWADAALTAARLAEKEIHVVEIDGGCVAWAGLVPRGDVCWLDDLWVEPGWMGRGIGSLLFRLAVERAARMGARSVEWEVEPNALGFYERLGAHFVRDGEPTVWGRVLPVMGVEVPAS